MELVDRILKGDVQAAARLMREIDAPTSYFRVESVGAGQVGIDIHHLVHTNLVVVTPAMGDEIQTLKAGILESAHVLVLNKSDHRESAATLQALKSVWTYWDTWGYL